MKSQRLLCLIILLLLPLSTFAQDWSVFEKYQETITRKEFCDLLDRVYNPSKTIYPYLNVTDDYVELFDNLEKSKFDFTLKFSIPNSLPKAVKQTFKTIPQLRQMGNQSHHPLRGIRIVIDPGHIGGIWADMEERSVIWGKNPVIREGDMNLRVAKLLKARLQSAGAQIYMTHETPEPVTPTRPSDLMEDAREYVSTQKIDKKRVQKEKNYFQKLIHWYAELFFYRHAEISQRAENIRNQFLPDLNICIHFNATERSGSRKMVKDNRLVFFVNGCYGADEIVNSKTRFYLFSKLLEKPLDIEIAVADSITKKMLTMAKLLPVEYGNGKYVHRVNKNPYLYARNLAANRQYPGPCVFLEPFYMNNPWTAERLSAGDYEGVRHIAGGVYRSIFKEYADAVADAVIETYSQWTLNPKSNPTTAQIP